MSSVTRRTHPHEPDAVRVQSSGGRSRAAAVAGPGTPGPGNATANPGGTLWLTGLSGAGKTTIATALADRLRAAGVRVEVLDGDELRDHLSPGLGFSRADRDAHVTRVGYLARLLARHGVIAIVPVIAPYAEARERVRAEHEADGVAYRQVYVATPVSECARRDLLFSGGKDSAVLLHLAVLAFAPGPHAAAPFPVMHVDTGHNFPEVIEYRDRLVAEWGVRLVVASVQECIDDGRGGGRGPRASRNRLQSVTLLDAIAEHGFDAAFGGGRRDEDKARAKERILSFRDAFKAAGTRAAAARAVGAAEPAHPQGRAPARVPAVELDRARHLAVHRPPRGAAAGDLLQPHAHRRRARRHAAVGRRPGGAGGRASSPSTKSCATAPSATPAAPAPCDRTHRHHRRCAGRGGRERASPNAAPPAPTTPSASAAMEDRKREGYF
jgi:adenylylsulfate kinase